MDGSTAVVDGPILAKGVNTILYCLRWEETVDFYRASLGLAESFSNDWFVEFELSDGCAISIADASRSSIEAVGGGGMTLSLQVEDLVGVRQALIGRRVPVSDVTRRFGSRVFDVHDPEGHRIEFWSR